MYAMITTQQEAIYIVLARNFWGKGDTIEEAKKQLKLAGGNLTRYIVYRLPEGVTDAWVDNMGTIRWEWAEGADTSLKGEIVAKRGVKL